MGPVSLSSIVEPDDLLRAGPLAVSPHFACAGWLEGRPLDLGVRQVRLLALLVRAQGRLLTRDHLYEQLTGSMLAHGSRAVDKDMWRIRRALGSYGCFLRSVRKVGYALDVVALEAIGSRDGRVTRM